MPASSVVVCFHSRIAVQQKELKYGCRGLRLIVVFENLGFLIRALLFVGLRLLSQFRSGAAVEAEVPQ
jgi:hypothetical protein